MLPQALPDGGFLLFPKMDTGAIETAFRVKAISWLPAVPVGLAGLAAGRRAGAGVAELVDALDLGSFAILCVHRYSF